MADSLADILRRFPQPRIESQPFAVGGMQVQPWAGIDQASVSLSPLALALVLALGAQAQGDNWNAALKATQRVQFAPQAQPVWDPLTLALSLQYRF